MGAPASLGSLTLAGSADFIHLLVSGVSNISHLRFTSLSDGLENCI